MKLKLDIFRNIGQMRDFVQRIWQQSAGNLVPIDRSWCNLHQGYLLPVNKSVTLSLSQAVSLSQIEGM
jgi:hypothetical protein